MQHWIDQNFFLFFLLLWLGVTTTLGFLSGWYVLMLRYPDRAEPALLQLRWESGSMGVGVSMNSILTLSVCSSGLRIAMLRVFGPFCLAFLVPWEQINVQRTHRFFWRSARLNFGSRPIGRLSIPSHVADRLARAAADRWPEAGPFPVETNKQVAWSELKMWVLQTLLAATFFAAAPRLMAPNAPVLPLAVAFGFPAVFFAISALSSFRRRK